MKENFFQLVSSLKSLRKHCNNLFFKSSVYFVLVTFFFLLFLSLCLRNVLLLNLRITYSDTEIGRLPGGRAHDSPNPILFASITIWLGDSLALEEWKVLEPCWLCYTAGTVRILFKHNGPQSRLPLLNRRGRISFSPTSWTDFN